MNKSAKYNFNLPSSISEEIADIDLISDNFRTIDEVMNKTDRNYDPRSFNAQSGVAVAQAIESIQPIDENTEFIFDGGDSETVVPVDIVVDSELSATSENAVMNKAVTIAINEIKNNLETYYKNFILLKAYPVGSVYISTTATDPGTLFGGTWEQIQDKFLLACGDTYSAGDEGGEAAHTLTVAEMPKHAHNLAKAGTNYWVLGPTVNSDKTNSGTGNWDRLDTIESDYAGSGAAHNNMPPYLAVYVWKRKS